MKRIAWICGLMVWLLLWTNQAPEAARKALLVGVGDYKNLPFLSQNANEGPYLDLEGPPNDVKKMRELLLRYDFSAAEIRTLLDKKATKDRVVAAIRSWLIQGSQPGDTLIFYFSGHGVRVADGNGDEEDGSDEGLALYDLEVPQKSGVLLDDEFHEILNEVKDRHMVVMLDSCFSAGSFRGIGNTVVSPLEATPFARPKYLPFFPAAPIRVGMTRGLGGTAPAMDVPLGILYWAASHERQEAQEKAFPDGTYGVFTYHLAEVLGRARNLSYANAHDRLVQEILNLGNPQTPVLIGNEKLKKHPIFNMQAGPSMPASGPTAQAPPPSPPKPERPPLSINMVNSSPVQVLVSLHLSEASAEDRTILEKMLRNFPFVRIVPYGRFADLILRGEKKDGVWRLRFVNSNGDACPIDAATAQSLRKSLEKQVVYVHNTKVLANLKNPDPPFRVEAWVTDRQRREFYEGEEIVFHIRSEWDASLLILNVDRDGNVYTIFPNKSGQSNRVRAGETIKVPDNSKLDSSKQVRLVFREPVGEEMVKVIAVASSDPFDFASLELLKPSLPAGGKGIAGVVKLNPESLSRLLPHPWSEVTLYLRSHKPPSRTARDNEG